MTTTTQTIPFAASQQIGPSGWSSASRKLPAGTFDIEATLTSTSPAWSTFTPGQSGTMDYFVETQDPVNGWIALVARSAATGTAIQLGETGRNGVMPSLGYSGPLLDTAVAGGWNFRVRASCTRTLTANVQGTVQIAG